MRHEARINAEVLKWARKRASLSREALAKKLDVKGPEKIQLWESAEGHPSFSQAHSLAQVLHIPFGYLFLSKLPEATTTVPDLRTKSAHDRPMSVDLVEVYEDALRKQLWLADLRKNEGEEPLGFVGSLKQSIAPPKEVATAIATALGIDASTRAEYSTWETFFVRIVDAAENVGITVMRRSEVGGNHHRKLDVDEFRGFAIADKYAPLVFINSADAKPAQLFTLVHELAHVWLAQTGVSRPGLEEKRSDDDEGDTERFCDRVAAEFLVPEREFQKLWSDEDTLDENARSLGRKFKVSTIVIARRAYDLGFIKYADYSAYLSSQIAMWRARAKEKAKESDQGPPPSVMVPTRNGKRLTEIVVRRAEAGELLWREAAQLLGCSPKVIHSLLGRKQRAD